MSCGPTKGKDPIQTHCNIEAKEGTVVLPDTSELWRTLRLVWKVLGKTYMTWGGVSGRQANKAQKRGRRSWGDLGLFAKHFMFLHFARNFLPNKLEYIQIKSDKTLTKKKNKQKNQTPQNNNMPCVWLWFDNSDSASLSDLFPHLSGSCTMGACGSEQSDAQARFKFCNSGAHH